MQSKDGNVIFKLGDLHCAHPDHPKHVPCKSRRPRDHARARRAIAADFSQFGTNVMAIHRGKPSCNGCHGIMDPLGFALEGFDAERHELVCMASVDGAGSAADGMRCTSLSKS